MKRLVMVAATLAMTLGFAGTASADPVTVGNLIAGPVGENVTAAGSASLAVNPPSNLPLGADVAGAGNPVPPATFAGGFNAPFDENFAVGGVGPAQNDVVAGNDFFGGDFTQAGFGNLSADTE